MMIPEVVPTEILERIRIEERVHLNNIFLAAIPE